MTANKHKFIALTLLMPSVALANAGVPVLFLFTSVFAFSLIPIILIESFYLAKKLQLTGWQALRDTTLANLFSTLIGIPVTSVFLVFLQMLLGGSGAFGMGTMRDRIFSVTLQALIPYEAELHWMIPVAGLVLLVPFFFVSWVTEYWLLAQRLPTVSPDKLKQSVRNANLITYGLLTIWPLVFYLGAIG